LEGGESHNATEDDVFLKGKEGGRRGLAFTSDHRPQLEDSVRAIVNKEEKWENKAKAKPRSNDKSTP